MLQPGKTPSSKKFLLALGAITLAALALRLHGLSSASMTADELDTLLRVRRSHSLPELINVWVRSDFHPPFTHVLEYFWIKLFGVSEGAIRFPFVLMGTGAVWFAGLTGRKWFSSGAGLAAAAGVAFLQFSLMYSQLARPYAPGLFFTMAMVWYWSEMLFSEKVKIKNSILFILAATGACYSHYFSLCMTGLVGTAGLFFLRKETWKHYLISGGIIVILFLPFTKIFMFHLSEGGVGGPNGWLGKPTPDFFIRHLLFIFDQSWIIFSLCVIAGISALIFFFRRPAKFQLLALLFWITPLLAGYFYSVYRNPLLQDSVLLFSFPFLLMLLFSWIPPFEKLPGKIAVAGIAVVLPVFVTLIRPFHLTDHFGRLKEIAKTVLETEHQFGKGNVACAFNVSYPYYVGYYWDKFHEKPGQQLTTNNEGFAHLEEFRKLVEDAKGKVFVYGWSTCFSPLEIPEIIREKYPYLIRKKEWFNSAVYVFSKDSSAGYINEKNDVLFDDNTSPGDYVIHVTDQRDTVAHWSKSSCIVKVDTTCHGDTVSQVVSPYTYSWPSGTSCDKAERLDSAHIYSTTMSVKVGTVLKNPDNTVMVKAVLIPLTPGVMANIVIQFDRRDTTFLWNGMAVSSQIDSLNWQGKHTVYFGLRLPGNLRLSDVMKVYVYSLNGKPFLLDDLDVRTTKGHRDIYGPRPDYQP